MVSDNIINSNELILNPTAAPNTPKIVNPRLDKFSVIIYHFVIIYKNININTTAIEGYTKSFICHFIYFIKQFINKFQHWNV